MMQDVLAKYTRQMGSDEDGADSPLREAADDFVAFGWMRGLRVRANMIELRKRTGHFLAVGYAWIEKVEFEPSSGVTLHLPGQRIQIKGSNLNAEVRAGVRLFEGITRGRVSWVRETERSSLIDHDNQMVLVEEILW